LFIRWKKGALPERSSTSFFFVINLQMWVGIGKKLWTFTGFLVVELHKLIFVRCWTAFSKSCGHFSRVFMLIFWTKILRNFSQSFVRQSWRGRRGGRTSRVRRTEIWFEHSSSKSFISLYKLVGILTTNISKMSEHLLIDVGQ